MKDTGFVLDLSGLRDVHALAEPSFFPPAIGWWLVLGGVILLMGGIWLLWYLFYFMSSKQYARRILQQIEQAQLPPVEVGAEMGRLLKRVALVCFPRTEVADLYGQAWADFLYRHGGGALTRKQADFIAQSTYMPGEKNVAIDEKKLYTGVRKWIDFVFGKGSHEYTRKRYFANNSRG